MAPDLNSSTPDAEAQYFSCRATPVSVVTAPQDFSQLTNNILLQEIFWQQYTCLLFQIYTCKTGKKKLSVYIHISHLIMSGICWNTWKICGHSFLAVAWVCCSPISHHFINIDFKRRKCQMYSFFPTQQQIQLILHTNWDKISTLNVRPINTHKGGCFCICSSSCSPLLVQSNTDPMVLTLEDSVGKEFFVGPQKWYKGWNTSPTVTGWKELGLFSLEKRRLWGDTW